MKLSALKILGGVLTIGGLLLEAAQTFIDEKEEEERVNKLVEKKFNELNKQSEG
nr:MAG TPA: hypothetical protein [Caudoviricetes sp.]